MATLRLLQPKASRVGLALLIALVPLSVARPTSAAAYWGELQSSASSTVYFSGGGGWQRDTTYYRHGYSSGGQLIEIKVEKIVHTVGITSTVGGYQHQMMDQEVRQNDYGPTVTHNHSACPCWTGTGVQVETVYPNAILAYSPNVVTYFFCWNCPDWESEGYCHYFKQGATVVSGGVC